MQNPFRTTQTSGGENPWMVPMTYEIGSYRVGRTSYAYVHGTDIYGTVLLVPLAARHRTPSRRFYRAFRVQYAVSHRIYAYCIIYGFINLYVI